MAALVIGPMLRYVDASSATIWVETSDPCTVAVLAGDRSWQSPTFAVHGHHYALVDLTELSGDIDSYAVELDGERVWPLEGRPPSRIRLLPAEGPRRLAFGSCRTSVPHDTAHVLTHGEDVLRAFGGRLMTAGEEEWPDLLVLLGDQVYADSPSPEMLDFIHERRDTEPQNEIADYEEYCELYRQAWSEPEIRWLLSTVPSAMIFDDHDLRDDWNTSQTWREQMAEVSWWRRRVISGLGAYWVYQHLGNLSPAERADDPLLRALMDGDGGDALDAFADKADTEPSSNRWSYSRDLGHTRLIMIDTRCARQLTPGDRRMLDPGEWEWLLDEVAKPADRIVIGSSIPFLLPEGVHSVQNWNEALCDGAWGKVVQRLSERFRQFVDLEHWAAFRRSFDDLARLLARIGKPVLILSGDVHYSYVAKARTAPVWQIVCSPIRNPLSPVLRWANVITQFGVATVVGGLLARLAGIRRPPFRWRVTEGPWFQNALATLTFPDEATWFESSGNTLKQIDSVRLR
ncbi:alkaline phosphatase D family protein [Nonomuraea cavernae]|uniref:Metallophosphatase n=1 Tax=Nonomuraea cavernae TaxID=2045107 RepID=A0A918DHE4_9ACTN|nr:alkaline phosphatase D family protein [Nonomuraea cavernae]MCA2185406.1 alkaline phosphatase family protein [Nonomuraea cavernae]GGO66369.1 metallophosphatase [Nonomuraea cavernae]